MADFQQTTPDQTISLSVSYQSFGIFLSENIPSPTYIPTDIFNIYDGSYLFDNVSPLLLTEEELGSTTRRRISPQWRRSFRVLGNKF